MNEIGDILSIIASIMTILGIGGLFTWNVFNRNTKTKNETTTATSFASSSSNSYHNKATQPKVYLKRSGKYLLICLVLIAVGYAIDDFGENEGLGAVLAVISVIIFGVLTLLNIIKAAYYWVSQ